MSEKNKIAIVTGANKGLGLALVTKLCEQFRGTVYLTSRDETRGKLACDDLKKLVLKPKYHQLDITDTQSVHTFVRNLKQEGKIAILINNAGLLFLKDAKEPKSFQAEETIRVNFTALVNFTETILPLIENGGRIINISSSSGHLSRIPSESLRVRIKSEDLALESLKELLNNYVESVIRNKEIEEGWGNSAYVVSKVGVNAYTFMLHRRLKSRDIKVNCVHPGYVISDMTRGAGSVTPSDAAGVVMDVALRAKDSGLYVWHNGQVVPWDGPDPRGYIDGKQ